MKITIPPLVVALLPRLRTPVRPRFARVSELALLMFAFVVHTSSLIPYASAQQLTIDWHTIDGGGGTSTGGGFSVSGTIGQADAGTTMANGPYSLTGGFWTLPATVPTEGAPTLAIAVVFPGVASISWTSPSTNWVLQESLRLLPAEWTNSASASTNPVLVPASFPAKFYRLFKP